MIGDDPKLDKSIPTLLGMKSILISKTPDISKNEINNLLSIEDLIQN